MDFDAMIGSLSWDACRTCRHWDRDDGGCIVDEDDWETRCEYDFVYCLSFEAMEKAGAT